MVKKILFLSNGHGEDQTAAKIIEKLPSGIEISIMPLVGDFPIANTQLIAQKQPHIIGPLKSMPSGGFSARNLFVLPKDILNGLFAFHYKQYKILKELRGQFDLVIAIGDIVPIIAALITKCPFIFVGVNKSDYYQSFGYSYTLIEKWLLKKYAKKVFARDEITAKNLKKEGIAACYAGNPLMDGIGKFEIFTKSPNEKIIGFLPGTRKGDLKKNIEDFEEVADELLKIDKDFKFFAAVNNVGEQLISLQHLIPAPFETVIFNSGIIIGLSGTGNEQAAGIGKPVVSFVGRGPQYNKKFAYAQKQLLGKALSIVKRNPQIVAEEAVAILRDHARYTSMAEAGKNRIGKSGAVEKITEEILSLI